MELAQLRCERCGQVLTAEQVNLRTGLAACAACNTVFTVAGRPALPAPPRPNRVEVSEFGPAKEWRWRWWRTRKFVQILFFALFWNGFMAYMYAIAIREILGGNSSGWHMFVFGLPHLLVGLGLAYVVVAGILNATTIRHTPGTLEIIHRPGHWFYGGGRWETGAFTSLRLTKKHWKRDNPCYRLLGMRTKGEPVTLLSEDDQILARFLAHELAAAMKLPLEEAE